MRRATTRLTTRALNRALLARQMLLSREPLAPAAAIKRLIGVQAQLARPPFIGLWTRIPAFRREELLRPIVRRQIVRVPAMRATLHLMTAADYVAFRGAIQPALARAARSVAGVRAAAADVEDAEAAARDFFHAQPATFDRLRAHLKSTFAGRDERALAYAVRLRVPLVQVPTDEPWGFAAACNFALAEDWLGRAIPTEPAPPRALVRRYLAAFGPATPADAQVWSGVPRLAEVFESLRPSLVTFRDERNRELFDLPDAPRPTEDTPVGVRFLPEYDNVLLGHQDRARVVPEQYRSRLVTNNLVVPGTFLADGFVAGLWSVERTKKSAALAINPFAKPPKETRLALEREAHELLAFLHPDSDRREVRWLRP